ncbi:MAG TPA: hypothetical protein VF188_12620 [Longimicrobiales bacterium]
METTTLVLGREEKKETAERVRQALDGEPGVMRVLARPDRRAVYVRHSAARAPRHRLLERLEGEGISVRIASR